MGRKRLISPEFFRHGALYDAEQASGLPLRLAFAGLWCEADRRGRFRWRPRELKLTILPYDNVDFGAVLSALASFGFVAPYVVNGQSYGVIPSFDRWQTFHKTERDSELPEPPPLVNGGLTVNERPSTAVPHVNDTAVTVTVTGTGTGAVGTPSPADAGGAPPIPAPPSPPAPPAVPGPAVGGRVTWVTPVAEAWEREMGAGSFQFERAVKALKPLVDAHGGAEVAKRVGYWVRTHRRRNELKFLDLSCARFAATWDEWDPDAEAWPEDGARVA